MESNPIPVAFLSEASSRIGTGHVAETLQLVKQCPAFGLKPFVWLTQTTPRGLTHRPKERFFLIRDTGHAQLAQLISSFQEAGVRTIVTNLRRVTQCQIDILKLACAPLVCIDELGGRQIRPDVIVNNSIVTRFHRYPGVTARVYAGPEYMCMAGIFRRLKTRQRSFDKSIRKVLVSMGGTDRSRATLRVVKALSAWKPGTEKHVVAGPGFDFVARLEAQMVKAGGEFFLHHSPSSLAHLLADADVGITAGGNTLYEMACLGTPPLVLHEDAHERLQGEAFENGGFGLCLGNGSDVELAAIRRGLDVLDTPDVLSAHSARGRALVDGLGADRILRIVREQAEAA